jgi:hypothetical protein
MQEEEILETEELAEANQQDDDFERGFESGYADITEEEESSDDDAEEDDSEGDEEEAPQKGAAKTDQPQEEYYPSPEEIEQLKKRLRTSEGRYGTLHRDLNALKEELRAKEAAKAPEKAPVYAKREELRDEFPEYAEGLDELDSTVRAELAEIKEKLSSGAITQEDAEEEKFFAEERAVLRSAHPDWQKIRTDPDFAPWVRAQDDEVQTLAASDYGVDAAKVISLYKESKMTQEEASQKQSRLERNKPATNGSRPGQRKRKTTIDEDIEAGWKQVRG